VFTWRRFYAEGALSAVWAGEEVVPASEYRALQHQVRELQRLMGKKTLENEVLRDALWNPPRYLALGTGADDGAPTPASTSSPVRTRQGVNRPAPLPQGVATRLCEACGIGAAKKTDVALALVRTGRHGLKTISSSQSHRPGNRH
jgi:hypothetical protein